MRRCLALVVVTLGLLVPSFALAAGEPRADVDCQQHNGQLTGHYTSAELRTALSAMPLAERDYSSCQQVITDALYRALGKRIPGTGSGGGGSGGTIIIIVVAVLILGGGGGAAYWAYRRNSAGDEPPTQPE